MGTRGCVGIGTPKKWRGVYNHWDSYPTGLAEAVWSAATGYEDLRKFAEDLLQFDEWRDFLNGGVCQFCGKKGLGQPHSYSITIDHEMWESLESRPYAADESNRFRGKNAEEKIRAYWEAMPWAKEAPEQVKESIKGDLYILDCLRKDGYPDHEKRFHAHSEGEVKERQLTETQNDPLFIEWVYLIDPEKRVLHVLAHRSTTRKRKSGIHEYEHALVGTYPLDGPEPDWTAVEKKGDRIGEQAARRGEVA